MSNPAYLPVIHGALSKFPKGPWYYRQLSEADPSLFSIQAYQPHKMRRKIWDAALTPRALEVYESRTLDLMKIMLTKFDGFAESKTPIDLVQWVEFLGFDVMGKVAFVGVILYA